MLLRPGLPLRRLLRHPQEGGELQIGAVVAPLLALSTAACFATRTDVQLLQSDIGAKVAQLQAEIESLALVHAASPAAIKRLTVSIGAVAVIWALVQYQDVCRTREQPRQQVGPARECLLEREDPVRLAIIGIEVGAADRLDQVDELGSAKQGLALRPRMPSSSLANER